MSVVLAGTTPAPPSFCDEFTRQTGKQVLDKTNALGSALFGQEHILQRDDAQFRLRSTPDARAEVL
jgi:hypothetical protein